MTNSATVPHNVVMHTEDADTANKQPSLAEELDMLAVQVADDGSAANDTGPERQQFELLLQHALRVSGGDYAFVLSPAGRGAYAEQFVKLSAAVERDKSGKLVPCYDTLLNRRPDPMILSVMRLRRGVRGKPTDIGLPMCLPGSHPTIGYFLMIPIESSSARTSVLFVANPADQAVSGNNDELMESLQALTKALADRQRINSAESDSGLSAAGEDSSARHYVQLMSASINAVVIVDASGCITAFNPAAEMLFGRDSVHALGTPFDRYLPQEFLMPILKRGQTFDSEGTAKDETPIKRRSVSALCESGNTVHLKTSAYFTRLGSAVYTTFVFDHENEAPQLPEGSSGHQQFQALTNVAPVGIVQLSSDWTCDYANQMWCELSGLSMDETIGEGWVDAIHAEDVVEALVQLREALSENQIFSRNLRLQRPTGNVSWVTVSGTVMLNELGQFTGCLLVLLDVTEAHLASEKLRFAANHDVLTGLYNRSAFLDTLQEHLNSQKTRATTSLLYLDLDGFKTINDTLGHDCGDELLRQVARRLESALGSGDMCARLGGDEFTIIVRSRPTFEQLCELAEGIVRSFNNTFDVFGNELHLSTSIGIAVADENTTSSDAFIKQADTALYKAKSSGRSRWVVYTREFQHEDIQRSMLQSRVRRATERQEFTLVFQPQFTIADESIVSFEALMRWEPTDIPAPNIELLVNVLEENGLINDVGQWVLEGACQQFMQWQNLGLLPDDCTISVNVSVAQLSMANFCLRLTTILKRCGLRPEQLNLEITESALIEKNSSCIKVINDLKKMGVLLSLDDFGTGYASLSYLTRLPIDFLKIDKSFVMAMDNHQTSETIVMSVLAMAGTLDIDVVAEGIENQSTLEVLRGTSCRYGQGFQLARPMKATDIERLLVSRCHDAGVLVEL